MNNLPTVEIDFTSANRNSRRLLDEREISVPQKNIKKFGVQLPSIIKVKCHRLYIDIISIPDSVEIIDKSNLITLELGKEKSSHLSDFKIRAEKTNYQVLLDETQFLDLLDDADDSVNIVFELKFQLTPKHKEIKETFDLPIVFKRAYTEPDLSLRINPEFISGSIHQRSQSVHIGDIAVHNNASCVYSHSINARMNISFDAKIPTQVISENIISLGEITDIDDSECYNSGIISADDQIPLPFDSNEITDQILHIKNLMPKVKFSVPIFLNMDKLRNPDENDEDIYTVFVNMDIWKDCTDPNSKTAPVTEQKDIVLTRDTRETKLEVYVEYLSELHRRPENEIRYELSEKIHWDKNNSGRKICFFFQFGNQAESGNGAVVVRNVLYTINPSVFQTKINAWVGRNKTFKPKEYTFKDEPGSYERVEFFFEHQSIKSLPNDQQTISCYFTFDYAVIKEINSMSDAQIDTEFHSQKQRFEHTIVFTLEKDLGNYWLSLDYGTSAIVAAFADTSEDSSALLDLQEGLRETINQRKKDPSTGSIEYNANQIKEFGTSFLPSDILLRPDKYIQTKDLLNNLILLAPTKREYGQNPEYFLPYLKSIIGSLELPILNIALNNLNYFDEQNKKVNFSKNPLYVQNILKNAYYSILHDYVEPLLQQKGIDTNKKLNKIVLTIPNSFTPRHIDYLTNLLDTEFPRFNKDYITFISESDAVACYYYSNRWDLNQHSNRSESETKGLSEKDEHVLVYDMGAGTVDLTYFRISPHNDPGGEEIEILLKMGSSTAGNYLDYKIAELLFDVYDSDFEFKLSGDASDFNSRTILKSIIVSTIKPALNEDKDIIVKENDFIGYNGISGDLTINTKSIRESLNVQEFIDKNTTELLNAFFNLKKEYRASKVPLDTVLLTGRGVQFNKLQDQLKTELQKWTFNNNVHYIDNIDNDVLKSIVVKGAMSYAINFRNQDNPVVRFINKNIHARYGVVYKDPQHGRIRYKELLNPDTKHIESKSIKNGITVYQYDTDVYSANATTKNSGRKTNKIDLTKTEKGLFVQSFSVNTADDFTKNRMDYITTMFEFSKNAVCPNNRGIDSVPVQIIIDEENQMIVRINQDENEPKDPLQIDIKNNKLFKESMWPFFE